MRGSAVSHACRASRRFLYSATISPTKPCGPVTAANAAFCEIDEAFDVEWLWSALHAAITSTGPTAQPQRHPVIEYDFDADPQRIVRPRMRSNRIFGRLCGTGSPIRLAQAQETTGPMFVVS